MGTNNYVGAIEAFKNTVQSIQRSSLFDVTIADFAYGNAPGRMLKFSVKSASFPQTTVGQIQVNYMGRVINWYGDRNYSTTWLTNVILDGGWQTYNAIYLWNQALNGANRIVSNDINAHGNFKRDAYVTAYSTDGRPAHTVTLKGLWPQDIAELQMDWGTVDQAAELAVTWVYDYVISGHDNSEAIRNDANAAANRSAGQVTNQGLTITAAEGARTTGGTTYGSGINKL